MQSTAKGKFYIDTKLANNSKGNDMQFAIPKQNENPPDQSPSLKSPVAQQKLDESGEFLKNGPKTPLLSPRTLLHKQQQNKYSDVKAISIISESKYIVYEVFSKSNNLTMAMKVFPYKKGKIDRAYVNEKQFGKLDHPNIVKILHAQECQITSKNDEQAFSSYILMEFIPYPDFASLSKDGTFANSEKLTRTYFKQLISCLQYLHEHDMAHLDIKMENLMLGAKYELKLIDFDFAITSEDTRIRGKGTKNFRAPELISHGTIYPEAADVYSSAIVLFVMVYSRLPYSESKKIKDMNLFELLHANSDEFWRIQDDIQMNKKQISSDFKELFTAMTLKDPEKRITIEEIKKTNWYNYPCFSEEKLQKLSNSKKQNVNQSLKEMA